MVIVDDGSKDKTAEFARQHASDKLKVVRYETNMGKGYALRAAFDHSTGNIIIFFDAGLDYQPEHIMRFWEELERNKADIVIGSKRHPDSEVDYPLQRQIISKFAQFTVKILFNLNVKDTQVGMKVFRREVLENILPRVLVKRYAFDIEILALAQRYGYKIVEAPVKMNFNFATSSVNLKAIWHSAWDTFSVFYRVKILKYYDKPAVERERMLAKYKK